MEIYGKRYGEMDGRRATEGPRTRGYREWSRKGREVGEGVKGESEPGTGREQTRERESRDHKTSTYDSQAVCGRMP